MLQIQFSWQSVHVAQKPPEPLLLAAQRAHEGPPTSSTRTLNLDLSSQSLHPRHTPTPGLLEVVVTVERYCMWFDPIY